MNGVASGRAISVHWALVAASLAATACVSTGPAPVAPRPLATLQQPDSDPSPGAPAPAGAEDGADLAAQARDPTAAVTAVQIRLDYTASFHNLPGADQGNLVLQPIIPWTWGEQRHISRITVPFVIAAPDFGPLILPDEGTQLPPNYVPTEEQTGLADIALVDFFLWDIDWGRWGVGPAMVLPTATDPALGSEKFSIGPAIVGITKFGEVQAGALAQTLFSVAGASDRSDVRVLGIQPFANYGIGDGWAVGLSELNYNYDFESGRWTSLPLGGRVEKLIHIGDLPIRLYVDAEYNFQDAGIQPEWTFRFAVVPLF